MGVVNGGTSKIDAIGNVLLTGTAMGDVSFGASSSFTYTGIAPNTPFIAKLNSLGTFDYVMWLPGANGIQVVPDATYQKLYIAGQYTKSLTLGTITLQSTSSDPVMFIAIFDTQQKAFLKAIDDKGATEGHFRSLHINPKGILTTLGEVRGGSNQTVTLGQLKLPLPTLRTLELFVARFDASLQPLWLTGVDQTQKNTANTNLRARFITADGDGYTYIGGHIGDPPAGATPRQIQVAGKIFRSTGGAIGYGFFVAKLQPKGKWTCP
jgi:hypothetical protein